RSLGFLLSYGDFRFLDLGDLTWNIEYKLVHPSDKIGLVDVYQSTHHGLDISNNPVVINTVRPRVAVFNNGPRKGGLPSVVATLRRSPDIQAIYQMHRNLLAGAQENTEPENIANVEDKNCEGAGLLEAIGPNRAYVNDGLTSVVRLFLTPLSNEQFVVPICTAMGFAHVLRLTGCDQHLVHLLVRPLQRVRLFLIPGAVLVGFIVNIPVISQTSTAVAIGPVLVPLLLAARISPLTTGAALLLGASLGGELINPGAPELQTVSNALSVSAGQCVSKLLPLLFIQLAVATIVFWLLSHRAEKKFAAESVNQEQEKKEATLPFRVSWVKAAVPLVPLALLFVMSAPLYLVRVPPEWLLADYGPEKSPLFNGRLIGAAMLIGVVVATLTTPSAFPQSARPFFDGAGYAVTHIISLIVTSQCFGEGVKRIGLANVIGEF